jgi:peroxiredoxin
LNRRLFAALILTGALSVKAAEVPRPAPEYTVNMPDGKPVKLSQYKGKIVLVEFLLVTCPHCQNAARILAKFQKEYGPKGLQIIGVSIDPAADAAAFQRDYAGGAFPIGVAPTRESVYSFLQYSLMSGTFYVPQIALIDRNGVIREQHGGPMDNYLQNEEVNFKASIEKALAESPAKKSTSASTTPKKKAS